MHCTLAITEKVHEGISVSIDITGNKYDVWYHGENVKGYRTFDSMDEAYAVYEKLAKVVILSLYSEEDRIEILNGDKEI